MNKDILKMEVCWVVSYRNEKESRKFKIYEEAYEEAVNASFIDNLDKFSYEEHFVYEDDNGEKIYDKYVYNHYDYDKCHVDRGDKKVPVLDLDLKMVVNNYPTISITENIKDTRALHRPDDFIVMCDDNYYVIEEDLYRALLKREEGSWVKTGDLTLVKQISEDLYFYLSSKLVDDKYRLYGHLINFKKLQEDEIDEYLHNSFGYDHVRPIEDIKSIYPDSWRFVASGYIKEELVSDDYALYGRFENIRELDLYLKEQHVDEDIFDPVPF